VQLTEGAAIKAANWSFSVGNGMRVLLGSVAHHSNAIRSQGNRVGFFAGLPAPTGISMPSRAALCLWERASPRRSHHDPTDHSRLL